MNRFVPRSAESCITILSLCGAPLAQAQSFEPIPAPVDAAGSSLVTPPEVQEPAVPDYPSAARAMRLAGTVLLQLRVDTSGNVTEARVLEPAVTTVADPKQPGWYWEAPPYFEYAIVDLNARTSTKVAGLPRAAMQGQKTLIVDGQNYVQLFRADRGSTLHRVEVNGTVTQVLNNPANANVQFLGRL